MVRIVLMETLFDVNKETTVPRINLIKFENNSFVYKDTQYYVT